MSTLRGRLSSRFQRRAPSAWSFALPIAAFALAASAPACSSSDGAGDPDVDPIAWVSPAAGASLVADDAVELTVKVNDPAAKVVRFEADGKLLATCDTTNGEDECRRGDLFRTTTKLHAAGAHSLVATLARSAEQGGDTSVTLGVEVRASSATQGPADGGAQVDAATDGGTKNGGTTPPLKDRGFLDPDRPLHDVFGGVSWDVTDDRVGVTAPPSGSTAAVAACMSAYGASIIKWADTYEISRGSVVATAITESSCSNPAGSSDGLSSGPLQVTGSTCAAVMSGVAADACKAKMHSDPDFSFQVGAKYMGGSYQLSQSGHDPPKIGAAYNAGSIRSSTANRWHMVVTGNHIERWVGAYDAYRDWEKLTGLAKMTLANDMAKRPARLFEGEHVTTAAALPSSAAEGQVYFVGDWAKRDGSFVQYRGGRWQED